MCGVGPCILYHTVYSSRTMGSVSFYCICQWGETELLKASQAGKVNCLKLLLDCGVQVNVQNKVSAV